MPPKDKRKEAGGGKGKKPQGVGEGKKSISLPVTGKITNSQKKEDLEKFKGKGGKKLG